MSEKPNKFKGYFLTVVCGLVVVVGALFLVLQHPPECVSTVSIFGDPTTFRSIWVIVFSTVLGPVFLLCCWWLVRGMWILYRVRRSEAKAVKDADAALARAKDEVQASVAQETPAATPEPLAEPPTDEGEAPGDKPV